MTRSPVRWAVLPAVHGLALLLCLVLVPTPVVGQELLPTVEAGAEEEAIPTIEIPEEIDISDMVLAAAKVPISIQESPSIITVVTREQMLQRGYRTLWDVLETIPGFEGNRWLFGPRFTDVATRGNTNTVLVLYNGVSVNNAADNVAIFDRRFPLDMIERLEVTSGPGGVLWGANAYLGIVNIITRDASSFRGVEGYAGWGSGPAEPNTAKVSLTAGERFFKGKLRLLMNVNYYTTGSPDYNTPADLLVFPLNQPNPDGSIIWREPVRPVTTPRNHMTVLSGNVAFGPVQADVHLPFNKIYRPLPNHLARGDDPRLYRDGAWVPAPSTCFYSDPPCYEMAIPNIATTNFRLMSVRYQDQFWKNRIGATARAYWVGLDSLSERQAIFPVGVFNAPIITNDFYTGSEPYPGDADRWFLDQYRRGGTVDVSIKLPYKNTAVVGGEFFQEGASGKYQNFMSGDDAFAAEAAMTPTAQTNGVPVHQILWNPHYRLVSAFFVHDEWRPLPKLAVSAGVRYQNLYLDVDRTAPMEIDTSMNPVTPSPYTDHATATQNVWLASAAAGYNIWKKTHVKVNFAQGFRPPRTSDLAQPTVTHASSYPGNPNLDVERSQAIEGEVNTVLLERHKSIRKLFLRLDYSYSTLDALIVRPRQIAENAGTRTINSVEFSAFLEGMAGWNFWVNYYFVDAVDADTGPIRQVARQKFNLGASVKLLQKRLELNSVLSVIGPRQDLNRDFIASPQYASTSLPDTYVSQANMMRIDTLPALPMWRIGMWLRDVVPRVDFSAYVDNLLGVDVYVPDSDWQARQAPFAIPMPSGTSFFLAAHAKI